ncbi:MAG: hypothetical protein WCS43_02780 [Verrucomicrobiota bacterium]
MPEINALSVASVIMASRSVWSKKSLTVKVDHVVRRIGDPNFGFPCDGFREAGENVTICKGGEKDQILSDIVEMSDHSLATGFVHMTATSYGVKDKKPIPL